MKAQKGHGRLANYDTSIQTKLSQKFGVSHVASTNENVVPHTSTTGPEIEKNTNVFFNNAGESFEGMRAGGVMERNRAVLRHVAHECQDCLAHIQRSVKQAKAAFVW